MKALVVEQQRNQYYSELKPRPSAHLGSSPFQDFGLISCRSFESGVGVGLLPTPLNACTTPISKHASSSFPKTPLPLSKDNSSDTKPIACSTPIPINTKVSYNDKNFYDEVGYMSFSYSELWAGPAYSNSPPPSSLPIPKFSIQPKRTVSLDLPGFASEGKVHPVARSAPSSPTRDHHALTRDIFRSADSATKTLRRILNLDADND